jgi:general secretion pathway protein J
MMLPSPLHCVPLSPAKRLVPQRGFTLIELLVALALMAILAIMSWRGIDGMLRAQEQTSVRADQMLVVQSALGQWGADLDAILPMAATTPIDWDGQVLRITRRSSAVPDTGALVVAWTRRDGTGAEGGRWMRWQSPPLRTRADWQTAWQQAAQWARTPDDEGRRREIALVPILNWQIFYHRGGAWSNPLSSSGVASADPSASIPDGVRLQITLSPGQALTGALVRDWVKPTQSGGRT